MTRDLRSQVRDYTRFYVSTLPPIEIDEILSEPVDEILSEPGESLPVQPLRPRTVDHLRQPEETGRLTHHKRWIGVLTAVAATILVVVGVVVVADRNSDDVVTEPASPPTVADPVSPPSVADPVEVSPSPRIEFGMANDAESDRIILFGGSSQREGVVDLDDMWSYDLNSNTWTDISPAETPSGGGGTAYDAESDRLVLSAFDETWAYDFNTNKWTDLSPVTSPAGAGSMAYDAESDRLVLFVQWTGVPDNETWAYDFNTNTWTKMEPTASPSPRTFSAMAYDAESDRMILFGGQAAPAGQNDETWAYDFNTNTWTNMEPATRPSRRHSHALAYDAESDRVVLFGGHFGAMFSDETWAYDFNTNTWTNMEPPTQPLKLAAHNLAYDAESDRVVLFGGDSPDSFVHSDETWAYDLNANTWTDLSPVQESQ